MRTILPLALVVAGLGACHGSEATNSTAGKIRVVAAEDVWGDVARQVGGERVAVTSIVSDPGVDPHDYEARPRDGIAFGRARLVIVNGLGDDSWASKLVAANGGRPRTVLRRG